MKNQLVYCALLAISVLSATADYRHTNEIKVLKDCLRDVDVRITNLEQSIEAKVETEPLLERFKVSVTVYNANPSQGWGDGLTCASGAKIDTTKLRLGELKYIAISHDLRKYLKWGDKVYVNIPNSNLSGVYEVQDLMNKRWTNKIDILTYDIKKGKWDSIYITKL